MGYVELRRIVEQVTKNLTPTRLEIRVEDEDVLHILIVSEQFKSIPISKRFEQLSQLFENEATAIAEEFTLIFQAWTKEEVAEIKSDGNSGPQQDGNKGSRRAAKPAEM